MKDNEKLAAGKNVMLLKTYVAMLTEKNKGLWANIHAKKKRGEKSDPRSKSYQAAKKAGEKINKNEMDEADNASTKKYDDNPALKGDQDKLPDKLQKGIIAKNLDEDDTAHEPQYDAPQGSKRDKQLDATKEDLKSGDPERVKRAYRRRERMERQVREKNEALGRGFVKQVLGEELSKKTNATLRKKAEERGLTVGSVEKEYKMGLAAWATSGSRKGMTQHQWAMARVNSATPSKDWAVVKKSKAKKK